MNIPQPIINLLKNKMTNGMTPKDIVIQMTGNNPILSNVIQMAEKGDNAGVEKFARNICKQRGVNFDEQLEALKQSFNK